jgi:DNA repair protein RecO (recombination protein O)
MIQSATGLILRTRPLTETSLIIHWLTAEQGRISTVAKGARRPKSPFAGKLDLFYLADFSFSRSRRSELHTLREVSLRETHAALRQELARLQQAAYGAALVVQTTEIETPLPAVYELMRGLVHHLAQSPPQPQTIFAFELKLLRELGLSPDLADRRLHAGTQRLVAELARQDWPVVARLKPSGAQLREIQQFLHGFLIYHLGKIPAGRVAALTGDASRAA